MNYLTPAELGITPEEHAGLIAIAKYLRESEIIHISTNTIPLIDLFDLSIENVSGKVAFSMSVPASKVSKKASKEYNCGTVACIGGHLSFFLQGVDVLSNKPVELTKTQMRIATDYVKEREEHHPLSELFYPHQIQEWDSITPGEAASAIEHFLTQE